MDAHKGWKILHLVPAQAGWKAVHCQESENGKIDVFTRPILCWALVVTSGERDAAKRQVRGIEQQSKDSLGVVKDFIIEDKIEENGVDRNQYFLGYDTPDAHKESDYWIEQAEYRLEREKRSRSRDELGKKS
jgi:hypothetical protein